MHRVVPFFVGCSLGLWSAPSLAQSDTGDQSFETFNEPQLPESIFDEGLDLDALLTTEIDVASSKSKNVFEAPSTVSVIDRQQLETYNFRDVGEALRALAGVDVIRTYLKQSLPTVRGILQEHYATKVLVLIDGSPGWLAVTGEGNIERISINEIERIEVLKGPASVLYGTNALTGAINIVTRRRAQSGASFELRGGERGHFGASGSYSLIMPEHDLELVIGASGFYDSGFEQNFTDEVGVVGSYNEYQTRSNLTVRLDYDIHQLRFSGSFIEESNQGVVPRYSRGADEPHRVESYTARYDIGGNVSDNVKLSGGVYFDFGRRDIPRGSTSTVAFTAQRSDIAGYRTGAVASARYDATDWLSLELGGYFDYRRSISYRNYNRLTKESVSENNMEGRDVTEYSLYAQAEVDFQPVNVIIGARLTNNELFDTNIAVRGTAVLSLAERTSIKLVAGQSFRAPTLFELYFATPTRTVFGNLELEPETSNSLELAFLTAIDDLFISALGYLANYENKIFRTLVQNPDDPSGSSNQYVNGAGAIEAAGLELELRYRNPSFLDAFFNYYFVAGSKGDEVDGNGNYNFKYVPQHSFALGLATTIGPVAASTVLNYIGARDGFTDEIDPSFTLDASLSFVSGDFKHSIVAKNISDENVENPEFVRRRLNSVPGMFGRIVYYSLKWEY